MPADVTVSPATKTLGYKPVSRPAHTVTGTRHSSETPFSRFHKSGGPLIPCTDSPHHRHTSHGPGCRNAPPAAGCHQHPATAACSARAPAPAPLACRCCVNCDQADCGPKRTSVLLSTPRTALFWRSWPTLVTYRNHFQKERPPLAANSKHFASSNASR